MSEGMLPSSAAQVRFGGAINVIAGVWVIAGIWLIAAPFVLGYSSTQTALLSDIILGIAIALIGTVRAGGTFHRPWLSVVNGLLGAALIASPLVLGFVDITNAVWNDAMVGSLVLVLVAWSALASPSWEGSAT